MEPITPLVMKHLGAMQQAQIALVLALIDAGVIERDTLRAGMEHYRGRVPLGYSTDFIDMLIARLQ